MYSAAKRGGLIEASIRVRQRQSMPSIPPRNAAASLKQSAICPLHASVASIPPRNAAASLKPDHLFIAVYPTYMYSAAKRGGLIEAR